MFEATKTTTAASSKTAPRMSSVSVEPWPRFMHTRKRAGVISFAPRAATVKCGAVLASVGERAVRLYLDSNVLISLVNREFGKAFEFMDQAVEGFFVECGKQGHTLVLSSVFFREVRHSTNLSEQDILRNFPDGIRLQIVEATPADFAESSALSKRRGVHFPDSLHAALAIRCKCDYIVTWNLKDYDCVRDLILSVSPRSFI
jgi:predicted nucleic acid-binding protein